jgi:hypothetical protein
MAEDNISLSIAPAAEAPIAVLRAEISALFNDGGIYNTPL